MSTSKRNKHLDLQSLLYAGVKVKTLGDRFHTILTNLIFGEGICLDVGSGKRTEEFKKEIRLKGWEYKALDIRKIDGVIYGDICDMPFPDEYANMMICSDVIEYIFDWKKAIKDMFRVLNNKGYLYFHFPIYYIFGESKSILPDKFGHIWHLSSDEIVLYMLSIGFKILRILFKFESGDILIIGYKDEKI